MSEQSPQPEQTVRELSVRKLEEIESDLRSANDLDAIEVIQFAIKELQSDLNLQDRSDARGGTAGAGFRQTATKLASTVQATSEAAGTAVRSGAELVAEATTAAKDVVLDKGSKVVRSTAAGVKHSAANVADAASVTKDVVVDKTGKLARSAAVGVKDSAANVVDAASVTKDVVVDKTGKLARSAAAGVKDSAANVADAASTAKDVLVQKTSEVARSTAAGTTAGLVVAYRALTGFAGNLDWNSIDPTLYLYAGTRGISRGLEEAHRVWETIPEQLRALGPEKVAEWLDGYDWSHIQPFSEGGSNDASNGIFELAILNQSRGASRMTATEIQAAQQVLASEAFKAVLSETARQAFTGALVGGAVSCVLACMEHGLDYQRHKITRDAMYRRIGQDVAKSAGVGAAISGLMTIMALAFPAIIPLATLLMIPFAVLGFLVVGGKFVRLGKDWFELLRGACERQFPDEFPPQALATL